MGNRLRELRRRRLLTQKELADAVGTAYQVVQRWETCKATPRAASLRRLCTALGVTADELLAAIEPTPALTDGAGQGTDEPHHIRQRPRTFA